MTTPFLGRSSFFSPIWPLSEDEEPQHDFNKKEEPLTVVLDRVKAKMNWNEFDTFAAEMRQEVEGTTTNAIHPAEECLGVILNRMKAKMSWIEFDTWVAGIRKEMGNTTSSYPEDLCLGVVLPHMKAKMSWYGLDSFMIEIGKEVEEVGKGSKSKERSNSLAAVLRRIRSKMELDEIVEYIEECRQKVEMQDKKEAEDRKMREEGVRGDRKRKLYREEEEEEIEEPEMKRCKVLTISSTTEIGENVEYH
ncbi:MAG: hypothetical protein M1823_005116 [Watsoniomyces obsoletus]|nr:MAG: hypothetical protein M1823_005116 [Watsoniomyces obsoletus]